ncbi:unnamed protein product [Lactuca virosa]|uniref:Uncharacterized protein n=1 Tax=Lactuca virosa TaxID=75947 RepID=A0AAU9P3R2_9ASTR|nr:unnamed protein product [Lactuca virosa]
MSFTIAPPAGCRKPSDTDKLTPTPFLQQMSSPPSYSSHVAVLHLPCTSIMIFFPNAKIGSLKKAKDDKKVHMISPPRSLPPPPPCLYNNNVSFSPCLHEHL